MRSIQAKLTKKNPSNHCGSRDWLALTKKMQTSNPYPSFPSTTNPAKRLQFGKKPQRSNLAVTFNKSRRKKYGVCGDLA